MRSLYIPNYNSFVVEERGALRPSSVILLDRALEIEVICEYEACNAGNILDKPTREEPHFIALLTSSRSITSSVFVSHALSGAEWRQRRVDKMYWHL